MPVYHSQRQGRRVRQLNLLVYGLVEVVFPLDEGVFQEYKLS